MMALGMEGTLSAYIPSSIMEHPHSIDYYFQECCRAGKIVEASNFIIYGCQKMLHMVVRQFKTTIKFRTLQYVITWR